MLQPSARPRSRRVVLEDARPGRANAGFSLMELLVVLLILTVVISIVVPTLRHMRDAARKSISTDIMAQLAAVVSQFKIDKNRLPGYFSPKDMGSAMNSGSGGLRFTGMENLMLDLAGGITSAAPVNGSGNACDTVNPPSIIQVGPLTSGRVNVEIARIGASSGGASGDVIRTYYKPDAKFFVKQCGPGQRDGGGPSALHATMPVLVDAWGTPILAWVSDEVPATGFAFAAADSAARARFYLASNTAFTDATSLGKLQRNQRTDSMLGADNNASGANVQSLGGLLGSPAFFNQPRGPIVFHSAGARGVYLGKDERGGKLNSSTGILPTSTGRDYFSEGDFDDFVLKAE